MVRNFIHLAGERKAILKNITVFFRKHHGLFLKTSQCFFESLRPFLKRRACLFRAENTCLFFRFVADCFLRMASDLCRTDEKSFLYPYDRSKSKYPMEKPFLSVISIFLRRETHVTFKIFPEEGHIRKIQTVSYFLDGEICRFKL